MKVKRKKNRSFFDSSDIVTSVHTRLVRDLESGLHEYTSSEYSRYFFIRQAADFDKKYVCPTSDTSDLEELTYNKFLKVNKHMANFRDIKYPTIDRISRSSSFRDKTLLRAKALMHFVLGSLTEDEWFMECRNSSGSSIGVPYSDTSPERKFTYPLSCTARVKPLFERYLSFNSQLDESIQALNRNAPNLERYQVVEGSRASTVDKTTSIRRMICIEPTDRKSVV